MEDERQQTYQRLVVKLLAMPGFRHPHTGAMVKVQDVIGLLAEEFLTERRGGTAAINQLDPLSVRCAFCGADVGLPCVNYIGAVQGFSHYSRDHQVRRAAMEMAQITLRDSARKEP